MSGTKRIIRYCRGGGRLCIGCINSALAIIAAVLALVVVCLLAFDTIPIPAWIVRQVEARIEQTGSGLDLEWESLSSTLGGELVIEDLILRDRLSGQVVLRCGKVVGEIDILTRLLGGPLPLRTLQIGDAALFAPPEVSPEGDEPLARIVALQLTFAPRQVAVDQILARIGHTRIALDGTLPAGADEGETPIKDWRPLWIETAKALTTARPHLARMPEANVTANLSRGAGRGLQLSAQVTVPAFEMPGNVHARALYAEVPSVLLREKRVDSPVMLTAAVVGRDPITEATTPSLHRVRAQLGGHSTKLAGWSVPAMLRASARIETEPLPPAAVFAQSELLPIPEIVTVSGRIHVASLGLDWEARIDRGAETVDLDYALGGDPDELIAHLGLDVLDRIVEFSAPLTVTGTARWDAFRTFDHADFTIRARDFDTKDTHYDEARGRVHLTPKQLVVDPIEVFDPAGQHARGSYRHHFTSRRFRILGRGEIFPRRLDSLLPSFYRELWKQIDPGHNIASGDADVRGVWGEGSKTRTLVAASGRDLAYKGQPVDSFSIWLRQATGFVELMDLHAEAPDGELDGSVAFLYPRETSQAFRTLLDLDTRLPLDALAAILGNEAEAINTHLTTKAAPSVRLNGEIAAFHDNTEKDLRIQATTPEPLTVAGVAFDWLDVTAHLTTDGFTLAPLDFGFAGGNGQADVTVSNNRDQADTIHLTAHLEDAEYTTAERILRRLIETDSNEPDAETGADDGQGMAREIVPPEERGMVDLSLETQGELGRWDAYTGHGQLKIEQAPLGQIELLGGLSRLFSNIGLNLATFHLEDLSSELVFAPGLIGFPNLEIRGPNLKIESQGVIALPSAELDFDAKVFFLDTENPSIRSFFGALLRPLGHAFEVTVRGSPGAPEWSFKRNPLNLLKPAAPEPTPPSLPQTEEP